jgi:hypothetical protein
MRTHLGGLAALCVGACFVWSCQGEVGPDDSIDSPGAVGAKGATGGTSGRSTGQSGAAGKGAAGSTGQPVAGAAGQPAGGTGVAPTAGTTGTGVAPTAGTAGTGVTPPVGTTGTGDAPASGMGGAPVTGTGGAPATGNAGTGATPATGNAGTGTTPATGSAGTGATPATGTTGTAGTGGAPVTPPPSTVASTIVPLYTSPSDSSWNAIVAAKMAHPRVGVTAIVNPANGPGGSASPAYASGIARLVSAGIRVVGYVATGYAATSPATVKADIDRWKAFYPNQLGGIFFDEQSNKAADVAHYRDLSQYAKAQGLPFTIGNPGIDTAESYIGALDTMLIYESAGVPSTSQMGGWHTKYAPSNFGVIPYATQLDAAFVRNARAYVQYIYLQNDSLPNPWDSLPGYFSDLLAALE